LNLELKNFKEKFNRAIDKIATDQLTHHVWGELRPRFGVASKLATGEFRLRVRPAGTTMGFGDFRHWLLPDGQLVALPSYFAYLISEQTISKQDRSTSRLEAALANK